MVGRLVKDPELIEVGTNKNVSNITLAIPRSFKNMNGEYETDFINCVLWDSIAKSTVEYCKKGNIVGVKGRIEKEANGELKMIAEKITFLAKGSDKQCNN